MKNVSPFPFDATEHPPIAPTFFSDAPKPDAGNFLQFLEEAAARNAEEQARLEAQRKAEYEANKRQRQIDLAEQTLTQIAGQGTVETARVNAAKILLDRFDMKEEMKKLKAEMAELKDSMAASNDSSDEELPPGLRRRK